jgi:uncharacterized protein (DUF305 family)
MTHCFRRLTLAPVLFLALSGAASAQHAGHGAAAATPSGPAVVEMQAATQRMHSAMDIPLSGDPDRDFAAAMIPHHQGAIEMARIQLQHGRDPVLRAMAEEIIGAQQKEIAVLQNYLAQRR